MMDRSEWLKEKRRMAEVRFDRLWAPIYDENWGATIAEAHQACIRRFLELCPPGSSILDAACGTGKYWPLVLGSGRKVFGIDQSLGMLEHAHAKHPDVPIQKVGLQEMQFEEAFDGAICMEAMECVFPEDWPLVMGNLYRAVKQGSYCYFTVELAAEHDIERDYTTGKELGLPVIYGESAVEPGYHYYPRLEQVREWVRQAGFVVVEETTGDEYQHFIVRKA